MSNPGEFQRAAAPLGLRATDLVFKYCNTSADGQCPIVVNHIDNSFRGSSIAYSVPGHDRA